MYQYFTEFMSAQLMQHFLLFIQWVLYKGCQGYKHFICIMYTIQLEPILIVILHPLLVLLPFPSSKL